MTRATFSTVTGHDMRRSLSWARLARNTVQENYRARLGIKTNLQRGAPRVGVHGVLASVKAGPAASTYSESAMSPRALSAHHESTCESAGRGA